MISERATECLHCGAKQLKAMISQDMNKIPDGFYLKETIHVQNNGSTDEKIYIFVDSETGVNYLRMHHGGPAHQLLPRFDNDGKIYIEGKAKKWEK